MPTYDFQCRSGHVSEQHAGYDDESAPCSVCGRKAKRLPSFGTQYINRTGDLGRPVTWDEKRQRENNARVQETVTANSRQIAQETGDKTAYRQHIKR